VVPDLLCRSGEWECWARRSKDGPRVQLPTAKWECREGPWVELPAFRLAGRLPDPEALRIIDENLIERYKRRPVSEKQRDGEIKTFERLVAVETWYDPVFAPAAPEGLSRPYALQAFADWCERERQHDPEGRWPERPKRRAVGKSLGLQQKDCDFLPTPSKMGPRRKSG
jgi:hypothetical protein